MSIDLRGAEEAVLGSVMLSHDAAEECQGILSPEHFYDPHLETIYAAAMGLLASGDPTDVIAVTDRLILSGDIEKVGGASRLHQLTSAVPTPSNAAYYAHIVRDQARIRKLGIVAQNVVDAVKSGRANADDLAFWARDQMNSTLDDIANDAEAIGWHADEVLADLATPPRYTPSPWQDINEYIGGWRPGALYVIGARPGEGKSILGLLAAAKLAETGAVAMCSLEMSVAESIERLYAARGSVPLSHITRRRLDEHDWQQIQQVQDRVRRLPLFINDRANMTTTDIRAHARSVSRKGRLAGILVDYLQLISSRNSSKPRWEAVGDMTRDLKLMAREYDVPVIALSQLNRQGAPGQMPTLRDLRESGSIEQDADTVLLLQRGWNSEADEHTDELVINIAKNRAGRTGTASLFWEGHFARVSDMSPWKE